MVQIVKHEVTESTNHMTMGEVELLEKLIRKLSIHYHGTECRHYMTEHEQENLSNSWNTLSELVEKLQEEGYTKNDEITS